MSNAELIKTLWKHRRRLCDAKTFEEYRAAHLLYVDELLEKYMNEAVEEAEATREWAKDWIGTAWSDGFSDEERAVILKAKYGTETP